MISEQPFYTGIHSMEYFVLFVLIRAKPRFVLPYSVITYEYWIMRTTKQSQNMKIRLKITRIRYIIRVCMLSWKLIQTLPFGGAIIQITLCFPKLHTFLKIMNFGKKVMGALGLYFNYKRMCRMTSSGGAVTRHLVLSSG